MDEGMIRSIVQVVVSVIATASVIGGAVLAGRWNARTKQIEATTPTYDQMSKRVEDISNRLDKAEEALDEERKKRRALEDRIDHLEDDRRADRSWIERTIRKVIDHDPQLVRLLLPWPSWVATTPPTLD